MSPARAWAPARPARTAGTAANALELARHGAPREPFYLTRQVGGKPFSLHAEGQRVILTRAEGDRKEVDLVPPPTAPAAGASPLPAPICPKGVVTGMHCGDVLDPPTPGVSPLDKGLRHVSDAARPQEGGRVVKAGPRRWRSRR